MKNILNYVIKHARENIKEELDIINELIGEGKINLETPVEDSNGNYSNLKEFIFYRYRKNPINNEIVDFMEKHNIDANLSSEDAYEVLLNLLTAARFQNNEKVKESWGEFKGKGVVAEEILSHIKKINEKNTYKAENLFKYIFESKENNIVFLFENVIDKFLGFKNTEFILNNYINKNLSDLVRSEKEAIIALLNVRPQIGKIADKKGDVLIERIFTSFPDFCIKNLSDENERKKLTDWYFKEQIEVANPYITGMHGVGSNVDALLSRKEWYKTMCGNEDILSVLIKDEMRKEIILVQLKKDEEFRQYLLNRDKNLLVEYLSKNPENALLNEYRILEKKLPELLTRESNSEGVLDSLIDGNIQTLYKTAKFYELLKILPSSMLLTGTSDRLLNWANEIPFYKMYGKDKKEKDIYNDLFSLSLSKIDSFFERSKEGGFADPKVEEARIKLCMQRNVKNLIELSYSRIPKQEELMRVIEQCKLPIEQLIDFPLIPELINTNRLPEDYLQKLIATKEREVLSESLSVSGNNEYSDKIKKRI